MSYWPDEKDPKKRNGNRRSGPDNLTKYVRFSGFLSWMLLILTGILADAANPSEFNIYVLDDKWGKSSRTVFRYNYIYASFGVCIFAFFFILISLIVDSRRQKRKSDHLSNVLLIAFTVDVVALMVFVIYFFI